MSENKKNTIEKRRKAYSLTLIGCFLAIVIIGLSNIWSPNLLNATLYKVIATLIIGMGLSGLLYTLSFKDNEKTDNILIKIIGGTSILLSILFVIQIWFEAFQSVFFGKITVTAIIVAVVAGIIISLKDDFFESKKMKDENYLD